MGLLEAFKEGLFKEQVQLAGDSMRERIQMNGRSDEVMSREEFVALIGDLIRLADFVKFEDQIMNYLNGINMPIPKVKARGENRKAWLNQLKKVGDLTFGSFEPLYTQLFASLLKDTETHGNNKTISAYVAILETVGQTIGLKYQASTPYDSKFMLGKVMSRENVPTTFEVVEGGRSIKLESVQVVENLHYFNPEGRNDGALLLYPLKYSRSKTFGIIGIDTLQEKNKDCQSFSEPEASYYQGVANTFAKSYANIVFKNRMALTLLAACEWINKRSSTIELFNVYVVQMFAGDNDSQLSLKPIMKYLLCENGIMDKMDIINEQIGSSLYECAITSESTVDMFNSKLTYCFPIRNEKGRAVFVVQLVSKDLLPEVAKNLAAELELIETLIYVLDNCQRELMEEMLSGSSNNQFDFERDFEHEKFEILFEKRYLKLVVERLQKLVDKTMVELLPDNTESPETSKSRELFKLVSDLIEVPNLAINQLIDGECLEKMVKFDSTTKGFGFRSPIDFKKLHDLWIELGEKNQGIRTLIDWVCLTAGMKLKADLVRDA